MWELVDNDDLPDLSAQVMSGFDVLLVAIKEVVGVAKSRHRNERKARSKRSRKRDSKQERETKDIDIERLKGGQKAGKKGRLERRNYGKLAR